MEFYKPKGSQEKTKTKTQKKTSSRLYEAGDE